MPLDRYFKGRGADVMAEMQAKHGSKEGKRIFYATANARGQAPTKRKQKPRT